MLAVEAKQADLLIGDSIMTSVALDSDICQSMQLNLLESLYGKPFGIWSSLCPKQWQTLSPISGRFRRILLRASIAR